MTEGHILKFLDRQQPLKRASKLFHPEETFGHCKESPDWFKRKFSLHAQGGYDYKFDEPKFRQKFKYQSQKNTFRVNNQSNPKFEEEIVGKNTIHNLKKGLLSQYLDKNSWMKQAIPLNGHERNQQSRRLNNVDKQKSIQTMKMKKSLYIASKTAGNFYASKISKISPQANPREIKTSHERVHSNLEKTLNPEYLNTIPYEVSIANSNHSRSKSITLLMGQKQKIRSERNQTALNKIHKIQKVKFQGHIASKRIKMIDSQFVEERMALTARQWGAGRNTAPHKSIERFNTIIGSNSKFGSHTKSINRGLLGSKFSLPVENDLNYVFEQNNFVSSQL